MEEWEENIVVVFVLRQENKDGPKNFSLLGILESAVNDIHKNKRRKSLD